LRHILESIDNIMDFMKDKTDEDLANDKMLFFAVVKNIEIIGEAAYMLTKDFRERHAEVPWQELLICGTCWCTVTTRQVRGLSGILAGTIWSL